MIVPSIKFVFDRKHTATNNKKGSIDLRITFERKQKFVFTGVKCYPGQWDSRNECTRHSDSEADNALLIKVRKRALAIIGQMVDNGTIDLEAIPALLKQKTVTTTFEQYIYDRMKAKQVTDYTKRAYHVFYSRFIEWGKIKFFQDITESNIRAWDEYLHSFRWTEKDRYGTMVERQYSQATIGSMHKNLKAFISDAVVDGYIRENPYVAKRIKIDKGGTRIDRYLTLDEANKIMNTPMPTKSLQEAADLFSIQILTGLAYVDLMEFDFTTAKLSGEYTLMKGKRHKTGVEFVFVLTAKAIAILEKYNYRLPKMPNQKYNVKLKMVADAAGIDKPLSTHDGRRTCGSVLLNMGVPIEIVSRILGHSSVLQTQRAYARINDDTIINAFKKLKESEV